MIMRRTPSSSRLPVLLAILVGLVALLGWREPRFIEINNLINILRQSSMVGLIALGMTLVILTGGIDLSVGSLVAVSALAGAGAARAGVTFPLCWGAALAAGALLGMVNGLGVARLRLPPFIMTLGMMGFARGLAFMVTGGKPLTGFDASFRWLGIGGWMGLPLPIWVFGGFFLVVWVLLELMPWGDQVRSVGSSPQAAWGSGVNVPGVTAQVYVLCGVASALVGLLLAGRIDSAQPTAGMGYEFGAIAGVVFGGTSFSGGRGSLVGTVIGVLIMTVLESGMNMLNVNPFAEQVVKGVVIAAALVLYGRTGQALRG